MQLLMRLPGLPAAALRLEFQTSLPSVHVSSLWTYAGGRMFQGPPGVSFDGEVNKALKLSI